MNNTNIINDELFRDDIKLSPELAKKRRWLIAHNHETVVLPDSQLWAATICYSPQTGEYKEWQNLTNMPTNQFKQWLGY